MIDKIIQTYLVIGIPMAIIILIFFKLIVDYDNKPIEILANILGVFELLLMLGFSLIGIYYFVKCAIWIIRLIW